MLELSSGSTLVWQIAASEAVYAKNQFIEREHVFIGICKVGDVLLPEIIQQLKLTTDEIENLRPEMDTIDRIFQSFELDRVKVRRHLRSLLQTGSYQHVEKVIHRSEECKTLFEKASQLAQSRSCLAVFPVHLLTTVLKNAGAIVPKAISDFGVKIEDLREKALEESGQQPEREPVSLHVDEDAQKKKEEDIRKSKSKYFLNTYGRDLTYYASEGKLDPLIGRRQELLQVIRTLTRKKKNNPILIGDAGVGKTAIVEGLAHRIASGNLTPLLREKRIFELSIATLVAGTKFRGEFEQRLTSIIKEASTHPEIILFIDEIHTVVGGGAAEGAVDAANILKPALARGEISCIGATTISEFRKHIEKDAALERRFQPIIVNEPSREETLQILEQLTEKYQGHHRVKIDSAVIKTAVDLSLKYLPDRRLPDKAIDLLDEACSRVKIPVLSFHDKEADLPELFGEVTDEMVAEVLSQWTDIPVSKLTLEEKDRLLRMGDILKKRVFGQDEAIDKVTEAVQMARAGLKTQKGPIGIFLFLGPTGVGKTELARALADFLFGSENKIIRLDMSEYMEKHSGAKLIGAPPGYVGYEDEGQLTGRLRKTPYMVVLLDEVEKAHPDVFDMFLQVFDEGRLTDSKGRTIDAKNSLFIMTSNLGSELYQKYSIGFHTRDTDEGRLVITEMREKLKKAFRPEFLNRIDEIIIFNALGKEEITRIAMKSINELRKALEEKEMLLEIEPAALDLLCEEGYDPQNGARPLERVIKRKVANPLSQEILKGNFVNGDTVIVKSRGDTIVLEKIGDETVCE